MQIPFGKELVKFSFKDKQAEQELGLLFSGWMGADGRHVVARSIPLSKKLIRFDLVVLRATGDPPAGSRLIFMDRSSLTSVYQSDHSWFIEFGSEAIARIPIEAGNETEPVIEVQIARAATFASRLEDIVFSSLAPVLRRRGCFMIHAFAAVKDGKALLLIGESGSGKTTTGLSLVGQGWLYLANDMVLVAEQNGSIVALPTPGGIRLTAESVALLPGLSILQDELWGVGKRFYPATSLVEGWATPAPVARILFPTLSDSDSISLQQQPRSITLARLMEGSLDRWDTDCLKGHSKLLGTLSEQAEGFDLKLGRKLKMLPDVLDRA